MISGWNALPPDSLRKELIYHRPITTGNKMFNKRKGTSPFKAHPIIRSFVIKDIQDSSLDNDNQETCVHLLQKCLKNSSYSQRDNWSTTKQASFSNQKIQHTFIRGSSLKNSSSLYASQAKMTEVKSSLTTTITNKMKKNISQRCERPQKRHRNSKSRGEHFFQNFYEGTSNDRIHSKGMKNLLVCKKVKVQKIESSRDFTKTENLKGISIRPRNSSESESIWNFQIPMLRVQKNKKVFSRKNTWRVLSPQKEIVNQSHLLHPSDTKALESEQQGSNSYYLKTINC